MNPYAELLSQIGIVHDIPKDIEVFEYAGSNEELYEFYDCASKDELKWAAECGTIKTFGLDYDDEQNYDWVKIHRYSRTDRFKNTLYHILNIKGVVPLEVLRFVRHELRFCKPSRAKIWNQIRRILKTFKLQRYYNDIPYFIKFASNLKPHIDGTKLTRILEDFNIMHYKFSNGLAKKWGRKYFPNLRFVALKLIIKHGITFPYTVPLVRTLRKQKYLNKLFDEFLEKDKENV